ncbi:hypothetical protein C1H46_011225 [Malus baccata]|uniref:Uncharacterized protein n=1 Tax=Malus baccata TaxID=106549 RepID=A0A540MWQ3_MALBA|nr:hypothetical protein C1H46_011225 [Malus baccata]
MCAARWYSAAFSCLDFEFSTPSVGIFRRSWTEIFNLSYFTSGWSLNLQSFGGFGFSILDDVLWTLITVVESLALACMLCFFFLFCGCTL